MRRPTNSRRRGRGHTLLAASRETLEFRPRNGEISRLMPTIEDRVKAAIHDYVTIKAALGIYDPSSPRRPKIPVASFDIELLEIGDDLVAHAAGPVVLKAESGDVERFLRVSVPVTAAGEILDGAEVRAAYIEETNPKNGACKETATLANE